MNLPLGKLFVDSAMDFWHMIFLNFSLQSRRVSRSVKESAMTSHEMGTRSFYMTHDAGPLE